MFNQIVKKFRKDATSEEKQWQSKCAKIWGDAKVLIGIPNTGVIEDLVGESPFKSFITLAMYMSSQRESNNWAIQTIPRMITHEARNALARQAVDEGYTHLAMIDSDHTFDKDVIHRLLLHEKDIIGVRAYKRTSPHYPCIFASKPGVEEENGMLFVDVADQGRMVADAIGFGLTVIKTDVFKKLTYPYFYFNRFGEDFNFCREARAAGFKIYVDTDVEIGHVGQYIIKRSDYLRERDDGTIASYDKNMVQLLQKQKEDSNVNFNKIVN
jgi:hypothetical protein